MELDFSGMFKKTPVEKAMERKRLHKVVKSIDVLLYTCLGVGVVILVGALTNTLLWTIPVICFQLIMSNYHMYKSAYSDGFRSGYQTAMDDYEDLGFVPERMGD